MIDFVLNGGQAKPSEPAADTHIQANGHSTKGHAANPITFDQLKKQYIETLSVGAVEENSLDTVKMFRGDALKAGYAL